MNPSRLPDDAVEQLAAVLAGVLGTGSPREPQPETRHAARRGATLIYPAVMAMRQVQEWMQAHDEPAAWDGLLHRRCLMRPVSVSAGASEALQGAGGPAVRRTERAGWELIRTTVEVRVGGGSWQVIHELARRASADLPAMTEKLTESGVAFDPVAGGAFYRLTYADVASWAEATGDRNAIHLLPGRAAAAGLGTGPDAVAAHGLLLGALSLAVAAPSSQQQICLRFVGSAGVPVSCSGGGELWARLSVDAAGGDIVQGRRLVLRRR